VKERFRGLRASIVAAATLLSVLLFAAGLLSACGSVGEDDASSEAEETGVAKIGYLGPLSGPGSGWCLPGLTGAEMWVDQVNADGGLQVGDQKFKVELVKYDTEGVPSKAIEGVKKIVQEDNVVAICTQGGADASAIQPFVTENQIPVFAITSDSCAPENPYFLGVSENYPHYHAASIQYLADTYPEKTRIAMVVQDELSGRGSMAWGQAAAEVNNMNVVYAKLFATDTTDFAPIASAIMDSDPDIVSLLACWPEYRLQLLEQLYLQGFKGQIESSEYELTDIFSKVPEEFMEGAVAHYPNLYDEGLPPECQTYYDDWMEIYGPGAPEDVKRDFIPMDWEYAAQLMIWGWAAQGAGTVEPAALTEWLLAQDPVPHFLGESHWWGEEVFGIDTSLLSPQYITEVHDGQNVTKGEYNLADWWDQNKEITIKWLDEYGLLRE
jgi:branched-chain amino acid transport system substrate-binding protein